MIKVSIPEKEIQRALRNIKTYGQETEDEIKKQVLLSAYAIQKEAKEKTPVDTGRLRSSIAVDSVAGGLGAEVGTNVEYAPHVEFGTKRQNAQPFLYPAWEAERAKFIAKASTILKLDKSRI